MPKKIILFLFFLLIAGGVSFAARIVFDHLSKDSSTYFMVKSSTFPRKYYWYVKGSRTPVIIVDKSCILKMAEDEKHYFAKEYINAEGDLVVETGDSKEYLHHTSVGYEMFMKTIDDYKNKVITSSEWPIKASEKTYYSKKDIITRNMPSAKAAKVNLILEGEMLKAVLESKNWVLVYYKDEVWVPKSDLSAKPIEPSESPEDISAPEGYFLDSLPLTKSSPKESGKTPTNNKKR